MSNNWFQQRQILKKKKIGKESEHVIKRHRKTKSPNSNRIVPKMLIVELMAVESGLELLFESQSSQLTVKW